MAKRPSLTSLVNRAFQIKPLIGEEGGKLHWVEPQDLYRDNLWSELQTSGEAKGLKETGSFTVEIPTGLRQNPQPVQAQVLPEIPKALLKDAVGYELSFRGMSSGEDGYEVATIKVYSGPMPDDIKNQPVYARGKKYQQRIKPPKKEKPAPVFNAAAATVLTSEIIAPETARFIKVCVRSDHGGVYS